MGALASQLHTGTAAHCSVGAAHCRRPSQMLLKLFAMFTLTTALVGPVSAASVEVRPFGEQDGRTIYALALAGDIKSGDDLRVASLLGRALVEDRFPGFMVLSSNGGHTNASLERDEITFGHSLSLRSSLSTRQV